MAYSPILLSDRSRSAQVIVAGVIPLAIGALAGAMVGLSAAAYWFVGFVAALGAFVAGSEHRDGSGGADPRFFGGIFYGVALLVVHDVIRNRRQGIAGQLQACAHRGHRDRRDVAVGPWRTAEPCATRAFGIRRTI
jgi:hypothetical protein